ncbi:MAG: hypothetical protein GY805_32720, partial [Chloroflexi bacterium]|nr:hypothetical protein [Chloroflexota bacterium]
CWVERPLLVLGCWGLLLPGQVEMLGYWWVERPLLFPLFRPQLNYIPFQSEK